MDKYLFYALRNIINKIHCVLGRQHFHFGLVSPDITYSARMWVGRAKGVIATKNPQPITDIAHHTERSYVSFSNATYNAPMLSLSYGIYNPPMLPLPYDTYNVIPFLRHIQWPYASSFLSLTMQLY